MLAFMLRTILVNINAGPESLFSPLPKTAAEAMPPATSRMHWDLLV